MVNKIKNDPRIDKRLKAVFGEVEIDSVTTTTATSREEILAEQRGYERGCAIGCHACPRGHVQRGTATNAGGGAQADHVRT